MDASVKKLPAAKDDAKARLVLRPSREEVEAAVRTLIAWAGDDPDRAGLIDTPNRVARAFEEFYRGYREDVGEALSRTFEETGGYDDIIIVRDIPFYSHCEHHMVPFVGKAHVGYFASSAGVVGLSKLARVVDIFSRRLQTQENLTAQVLNAIDEGLKPRGVAVMIEAEHQCMTLRGVRKHGASTVTTGFSGVFRDDPAEQIRFISLVRGEARIDFPSPAYRP